MSVTAVGAGGEFQVTYSAALVDAYQDGTSALTVDNINANVVQLGALAETLGLSGTDPQFPVFQTMPDGSTQGLNVPVTPMGNAAGQGLPYVGSAWVSAGQWAMAQPTTNTRAQVILALMQEQRWIAAQPAQVAAPVRAGAIPLFVAGALVVCGAAVAAYIVHEVRVLTQADRERSAAWSAVAAEEGRRADTIRTTGHDPGPGTITTAQAAAIGTAAAAARADNLGGALAAAASSAGTTLALGAVVLGGLYLLGRNSP